MELSHLEAFERVARTGSFTRAAEELDLTQPSVSSRIATLERELGGALFERGGRRLKLTTLGQVFLQHADRALAAVHDGREAVRRLQDGKMGRVVISTYPAWAIYWLADPMDRFRDEYPAIDINIISRLTNQILNHLYEGVYTLGMIGPPLWDKGLHVHAAFQEPIRLVVSSHHALADLYKRIGLIYLSDIYEHTLYQVGYSPRVNALMDNIMENARRGSGGALIRVPAVMAIRAVIKGQGVAFLPDSFIEYHLKTGELISIEVKDMPVIYNEPLLISLKGRDLDAPTEAFIRMVAARWRHIRVS